MKKNVYQLVSGLMLAALLLGACAPAATQAPTSAPTQPPATSAPTTAAATATTAPTTAAATATTAATTAPTAKGKICEVTDTGGVDDRSFNAASWAGAQEGAQALGWEATYLESKEQTDYEKNLNEFLKSSCNLIVPVGFLLGDAAKAAAEANPDQNFAIVDFVYDPVIPNVRGSTFQIEQATYLAGYLAAGMTKTGKVGVFGGINIPPVDDFMVGFQEGIEYYNSKHGTQVQLLGWDNAKKDGLFTGDFTDQDKGKTFGQNLIDEGADIVMPVAGPVGIGTLAAVEENKVLLIGVDTDWSAPYAFPDKADFILASALKGVSLFVSDSAKLVADGKFKGETFVGNLENERVGLAYSSAWDSKIPAELKTEIDQVKADIISGKIKVNNFASLP